MSSEEDDVKRRRVENDSSHSQPQPSASIAPTHSQPLDGAPIKSFRDLVFSVSGTLPAVADSKVEEDTSQLSGRRKLAQNLGDCEADASEYKESRETDRKEDVGGIVSESDVGITEYISRHEGFSGILKQR